DLARQRRGPSGRARTRAPGRGRLPAHRARLPRHRSLKGGRERDTATRISRPPKRQAVRQGIGPWPCALARRHPRPRQDLAEPCAARQAAPASHARATANPSATGASGPLDPPATAPLESDLGGLRPTETNPDPHSHGQFTPDPLDFHPSSLAEASAIPRRALAITRRRKRRAAIPAGRARLPL